MIEIILFSMSEDLESLNINCDEDLNVDRENALISNPFSYKILEGLSIGYVG